MRTIVVACFLAPLSFACDDPADPIDADVRDASEPQDASDPADASGEDRSLDASLDGSFDASSSDAQPEDAGAIDGGEPPRSLLVFVGSGEWGATIGSISSHRFDPEQSALVRTRPMR